MMHGASLAVGAHIFRSFIIDGYIGPFLTLYEQSASSFSSSNLHVIRPFLIDVVAGLSTSNLFLLLFSSPMK